MMAAGALAWILSCALFGMFGAGTLAALPSGGTVPLASLAWATPFMAFGFLLCPYLDPTFHLALQRAPSRHAFAVFGAAFAVMLLFTAAFADASQGNAPEAQAVLWGSPIHAWQWSMQAAFTMLAVAAAMRSLAPVASLGGTRALLPAIALLACVALGWQFFAEATMPQIAAALSPASGAVPGEATYLRWLGLYGVLFPAMLLLGLRGAHGVTMAVAIVAAGTLAESGMIGGHMPLLAASVALLLVAARWNYHKSMATREIAPTDSR